MNKYLILSFFILTFSLVNAQQGIVQCPPDKVCDWQDFINSTQNLIRTIVQIAFFFAILLTVAGAFLIMFTGPNPGLYTRGKNMIFVAIIGYSLLLLAGIIFDLILDFFKPQFRTFILPNFALAQTLEPGSFFNFLKNAIGASLNCGKNAIPIFNSQILGQIFACLFEVLGLLRNVALVLLVLAIVASAAYLITTPLFGLENIKLAWQILVWSIIGLIIVLLADVIRDQILKILKP